MQFLEKIKKIDTSEILLLLLIFFFTFPSFSFNIDKGLDASYYWFFNYFFHYNYDVLTHLVYPVGPLGFFVKPLNIAYNSVIYLVVFSVIRLLLIYKLLTFNGNKSHNYILAIIIPLFIQSIGYTVVFLVFLLIVEILLNKNSYYKFVLASLLAVFIYFVKLSDGVEALLIVALGSLLHLIKTKNYKQFAYQLLSFVLVFAAFNLLVFKTNLSYAYMYFINNIKLSTQYSSVLSSYTDTIPYLFIIAWGLLASLFFVFTEKNIRLTYILSFILMFATWKHGVARMDYTHFRAFVYALIIILLLTNYINGLKKTALIISVFALSLFYLNLNKINNDKNNYFVPIPGINNFVSYVSQISDKEYSYNYQKEQLRKKSFLPNSMLDTISDNFVDIYPVDLTYIPANNLNYKPRKTIHSGGNSAWFDSLDAENICKKNIKFAILQQQRDTFGNNCGSLDYRYFLNDHPKLLPCLFLNYKKKFSYSNSVLFEASKENKKLKLQKEIKINSKLNRWIKVPENNYIIKASVSIKHSFSDKIKSIFYKPDELIIDYKFSNARVLSYALIESCANENIWINPFIKDVSSEYIETPVKYIKLRYKGDSVNTSDVKINFKFYDNKDLLLSNLRKKSVNYYYIDTIVNYDTALFKNNVYNCGFYTTLSDSVSKPLNISYNSMLKLDSNKSKIKLVVSIEKENKNLFWQSYDLSKNIFVSNKWRKFKLKAKIPYKQGTLKIYLWNPEKEKFYIETLNLQVYKGY